jgi:hypothetical protein
VVPVESPLADAEMSVNRAFQVLELSHEFVWKHVSPSSAPLSRLLQLASLGSSSAINETTRAKLAAFFKKYDSGLMAAKHEGAFTVVDLVRYCSAGGNFTGLSLNTTKSGKVGNATISSTRINIKNSSNSSVVSTNIGKKNIASITTNSTNSTNSTSISSSSSSSNSSSKASNITAITAMTTTKIKV